MAPSTYYAAKARPLSARAVRDALLVPALVAIWSANYRVYGVRKLWRAAQRAGHDVGRDQVARLKDLAGIEGLRRGKKRKTTKADAAASRHPDLVERTFVAAAPNSLWVSDLTYSAQLSVMCSRSGSDPSHGGLRGKRQHIITDARGRREAGHGAGTGSGSGWGR